MPSRSAYASGFFGEAEGEETEGFPRFTGDSTGSSDLEAAVSDCVCESDGFENSARG